MKTNFRDEKGREWILRVTVGHAMRLRDQCGIDVDQIIKPSGSQEFYAKLLDDRWLLIRAIELLTDEQRQLQQIERVDFLDSLDGNAIDEALEAFLYAIAASLGKLQRQALLALIPKTMSGIDQATEKITAKIAAMDLTTEINKALASDTGV